MISDAAVLTIFFIIGIIFIILYIFNIETGFFILIGFPCSIFSILLIISVISDFILNL